MAEHIVTPKTYATIFVALCVLMVLTVAAAMVQLPGNLNITVALAIAITKALLIILFFMHVKYSSRLTQLFVTGAFLWLLILIALTMMDFVARKDRNGPLPDMVYSQSAEPAEAAEATELH